MPSRETTRLVARQPPPRAARRAAAAVLLAGLAACSSPEDRAAKERLYARGESRAPLAPLDWFQPAAAGADEAAARLGSFEWTATVTWSVFQAKGSGRVQAVEHHRVRQMASGDFEVESEIDPGEGGEGSEGGKHVVYANGRTYARGLYAPFGAFRERPTDRGRDARRFRDESFGLLADLAALCGPALAVRPAGDGAFLGRPARRLRIALAPGAAPEGPSRLGAGAPDGGPDEDTRRRLAFLDGRVPVKVEGEVLADAGTGVPLAARLRAAFQVKDEPDLRVEVELSEQMKVVGAATPPVAPPRQVLPDERKPRGVARALEAAGLKKAREEQKPAEEGADEGD